MRKMQSAYENTDTLSADGDSDGYKFAQDESAVADLLGTQTDSLCPGTRGFFREFEADLSVLPFQIRGEWASAF